MPKGPGCVLRATWVVGSGEGDCSLAGGMLFLGPEEISRPATELLALWCMSTFKTGPPHETGWLERVVSVDVVVVVVVVVEICSCFGWFCFVNSKTSGWMRLNK